VLRGDDGRIWGIWDFAGDPIPDALIRDIAPLAEAVPPDLAALLDDDAVTALQRRVQRMLIAGVLPVDRTGSTLLLAASASPA
jgi:hypothetical protein